MATRGQHRHSGRIDYFYLFLFNNVHLIGMSKHLNNQYNAPLFCKQFSF